MIQIQINFILMGLINYFMFQAQLKYLWSLENFKVNEILCVTTFYTIRSPKFPKNFLTIPCIYRAILWNFINNFCIILGKRANQIYSWQFLYIFTELGHDKITQILQDSNHANLVFFAHYCHLKQVHYPFNYWSKA